MYIDYAKTCTTTKISTVAGYHVVLSTLLFLFLKNYASIGVFPQRGGGVAGIPCGLDSQPKNLTDDFGTGWDLRCLR